MQDGEARLEGCDEQGAILIPLVIPVSALAGDEDCLRFTTLTQSQRFGNQMKALMR